MASAVRKAGTGSNLTAMVPSGVALGDLVVGHLPLTVAGGRVPKEVSVQLADKPGAQGHLGVVRVDGVENVAVSRDLLLGAVSRSGSVLGQLDHAVAWRGHSLQPVGRFCALDDGLVSQSLQHLG